MVYAKDLKSFFKIRVSIIYSRVEMLALCVSQDTYKTKILFTFLHEKDNVGSIPTPATNRTFN